MAFSELLCPLKLLYYYYTLYTLHLRTVRHSWFTCSVGAVCTSRTRTDSPSFSASARCTDSAHRTSKTRPAKPLIFFHCWCRSLPRFRVAVAVVVELFVIVPAPGSRGRCWFSRGHSTGRVSRTRCSLRHHSLALAYPQF